MDNTIRLCYARLGNHRAVAHYLKLPLHHVMWILGMMSDDLYRKVNSR